MLIRLFTLFFMIQFTAFYSQNASYVINGDASGINITGPDGTVNCNCFQLTPDQNAQVGSVWNENMINLRQDFRLEFDVYLGTRDGGGADGIAFGLQPINTSIGNSGGGLGMQGVSPSVGVYLDTYRNGNNSDPNDDHISINLNGNLTHTSSNNVAGPNNLPNIEDGNWRRLIVDWDASVTRLNVFFVNTSTPELTYTSDIVSNVFSGDSLVFWGFTGSTGGSRNLQKFCTVSDLEAPEITSCPSNVTLQNSPGDCYRNYSYSAVTASDNCGVFNINQVSGLPSGSNFPVGTTENIFVVTDGGGNTDTCRFTVTVSDTSLPSISCPPNQTDYYNSSCEFIVPNYQSLITASDNCFISPTIIQSPAAGTTINSDTIITFTINDSSSNSTNCSFRLLLLDSILPNVTCPSNQADFYNSNCEFTIPDYTSLITSSDNCDPSLIVTQTPPTGNMVSSDTSITFLITDDAGNSTSCSFNLFLSDSTMPQISCPSNQTAYFSSTCDFTLLDYTTLLTISDNCDPNLQINQHPPVGSIVNSDTVVKFVVIDTAGNADSCSINIVLIDTLRPSITCPLTQIDYYNQNCEFTLLDYSSLITVNDNCDTSLTIVQTPSLGNTVSTDTVIKMVVLDDAGNRDSCTFMLNLLDTIPPQITCPSTQTDYLSTNCEFTLLDYLSLLTITDNCDTALSIIQTPPQGSVVSSDTIIKFVVTDDAGNSDSCVFDLVLSDSTAPQIVCPTYVSEYFSQNCDFPVADYSLLLTISDNCDTTFNTVQTPSVGDTIFSDTTIKFVVTDNAGNSDSCFVSLTLSDTIPPSISCPSSQIRYYNSNCEYAIGDFTSQVTISDNCDTLFSISQFPITGSLVQSDTLIKIIVSDATGNVDSCIFNLFLLDTIQPTIVACPNDTIFYLDSTCVFTVPNFESSITALDNCDTTFNIIQSISIGDTITSDTTISIIVTDLAGNSSSCDFIIQLRDTISPIIICPSDTTISLDSNTCLLTYNLGLPTVFNDCESLIPVLDSGLILGNTYPKGQYTSYYSVTDSALNISTCSFTITVVDSVNPSINCPVDTTVFLNSTCEYEVGDFLSVFEVEDNCGIDSLSQFPSIGTLKDTTFTLEIRAIDSSGNQTLCTTNVLIADSVPPTIVCPGDTLMSLNFDCEYRVGDFTTNLQAYDSCSYINSIFQYPSIDSVIGLIGVYPVSIHSVDNFGNSSSCFFNLEVVNGPLYDCDEIYVPNVFSPNGDGINDIFKVRGATFELISMKIFNRWGQLIYEDRVGTGWDGWYSSGIKASTGNYSYLIEVQPLHSTNERSTFKHGFIQLLD